MKRGREARGKSSRRRFFARSKFVTPTSVGRVFLPLEGRVAQVAVLPNLCADRRCRRESGWGPEIESAENTIDRPRSAFQYRYVARLGRGRPRIPQARRGAPLSDLLLVLRSYLVIQLLALAAWPWLAVLVGAGRKAPGEGPDPPPDLAFPPAKSLGVVLAAYLSWLGGFLGLPLSSATAWAVGAAVGAAGWALLGLRPADLVALFTKHRRAILLGETIFLAAFLSFCHIRALTPDATFRRDERGRTYDGSASEKFTNLALLTGLYREQRLPPRDTWLASYPINYYYFGHFEWATFCRMAFVPPRVGFNIAQAAVFALVAANAFSIGLCVSRHLGAGLVAAYALPVMGSPYGFIQLLFQGVRNYSYWDPSRIVEGTIVNGQVAGPITEFPFFTFILGDLHAHALSFPTYLLAVAVAFLFPFGERARRRPLAAPVGAVLLALLVAATAMTNMWDVPSLGLVIAAILAVRSVGRGGSWLRRGGEAVALAGAIGAAGAVLLLPHLRTFELPVGVARDPKAFYIGPLKWLGASHLSEFKDYMVHFGFFLLPLVIAIHARLIGHIRARPEPAARSRLGAFLGAFYLAALYVFLFAQRWFLLFFLASMTLFSALLVFVESAKGRAAAGASADRRGHRSFAAVGGLSAVAFFLTLFAELWVVDDGYSGPWERYNTVFKIYNVAWLLYGLSFAVATAAFLPPPGEARLFARPRFAWRGAALAIVLAMGFAYPYAATKARVREHRIRSVLRERVALPPGPALDAERYYASVNRGEYRLVEWIRKNIRGKVVVAEGCRARDSYTLQGRIATFTGLCTVIAWPQHEANWRSRVPSSRDPRRIVPIWVEMNRRLSDLRALYTTRSEQLIRSIVARYGIAYIVVGRWERALYGPGAGARLAAIYRTVFRSDETILLETSRGK